MITKQFSRGRSIAFGERLAASGMFDALFKDGRALVEETAAYLDGPGRAESRYLTRAAALSYASESMRLTTRLMQIASWLLLQRAVNEGEMSQGEAASDKRRSRTAWQDAPIEPASDGGLPSSLTALIDRSLLLQRRIQRLDAAITEPTDQASGDPRPHPLEPQLARLREAFTD